MNHASKTLHVFVVGLDNFEQVQASRPTRCAYGIFYDNTRYSSYNSSFSPCHLPGEVMLPTLAVEYGILSIVDHGPPYMNLVIETEAGFTVNAIKYEMIAREKSKGAAAKAEVQGFSSVYDRIGRIVDLIEHRTRNGNYFVDIINSHSDPTAKEGLQRARSLALEALNENVSTQPAREKP